MATTKTLERTYIIPLRREWLKVPMYKRSKKAVTALKQFVMKHMKTEDVHIGKFVNEHIWQHGIRNPPGKVKVNCKKFADGRVAVELFGKNMADLGKKEEKKQKGKLEETVDKAAGKKTPKTAEKKEAKEEKEEKQESTAEEKKKEEKTEKKESKPAAKQSKQNLDAIKSGDFMHIKNEVLDRVHPRPETRIETEIKDKTEEAVSRMVAQAQKVEQELKGIEPKPKSSP